MVGNDVVAGGVVMTTRPHSDGRTKVWLLAAVIGALAIALTAAFAFGMRRYDATLHIPWPILTILFGLTEIHVINIQFRRETQSFSLSEIPLVLGLFFASPAELVLAQVLGAGVALIAHRKQPAVKWSFNLAHLALEAIVAVLVFRGIAAQGALLGAREIVATFAATTVAIVLGVLAVVSAIAVSEGGPQLRKFARVLNIGLIGSLTNTALVLTGVVFLRVDRLAVWLLLIPAMTLFVAYRGYSSYRQQHETLEQLYDATRLVQRQVNVDPVMRTLLEAARQMFRAERAIVTLFPKDGETNALEYALGEDGRLDELNAVRLEPTEGVWARVASERQGVLLSRPIENARLREHFARDGIRDLMVAPVFGEGGIVGTITVGNRVSDIETFTPEDLRLFETYANHVSVSLEKARLLSQLQTSVVDLQELHRLKDEFLATVSHELRTPLTSIMGFITVLKTDPSLEDVERREYLDVMERQSHQLRGLIEDLLMAARLESNAFRPAATRVHVPKLIQRVVEGFASWQPAHQFATLLNESVPDIVTDEETVHRILANLVNNAVKNSPEGSPVTITARPSEDGLQLSVTDEGIGIAADMRDKIFERFFQVDGGFTRKVGGTGLGLYICRRLSETIGARVWLERSEPGKGSTFCMWLPVSMSSDVVPLAKPRLVVDLR